MPLASRRHAHLMGISLPIPAVGSLRSQHDEIMINIELPLTNLIIFIHNDQIKILTVPMHLAIL